MERYCNPDNVIDSDMRRDLYASDAPVYSNSFFKEMAMVVKRQVSLAFRDSEFVVTGLTQAFLVGVFLGSLFFQLNPQLPTSVDDDQGPALDRFGVLFNSMIHCALAGASQIPIVLSHRPVFYKQSDSFFFRTVNYVIAEALSVLPMATIESTLLSVTVFWIAELVPWGENSQTGAPSDVGGCFMLYWLLMLALNVSVGAFLRALASLSSSSSIGQVFSGLTVASICVFSGYILTYDTIPPWFIWIYWLSPMAWGFHAGALVIFTSDAFTMEQQVYSLRLFGIERDTTYIWAGILWLIGYALVAYTASFLGYVYLRFDGGSGGGRMVDTDMEEGDDADLTEVERVWTERSASAIKNPSSDLEAGPVDQRNADTSAGKSALSKADFIPADLEFRDLWYSVKRPGDKRGTYSLSLLKGITGFAEAGTLTALMGSSGAGKSTLMDVLALRKTGGRIEGEVLVNGRPQDKTTFSRIIGYVEQNDIHSPKATVHEALIFSAFLRQPSDIPRAEKQAFVERVIETLRLEPIRDRMIGFKSAGGLSTEQAKRLTIDGDQKKENDRKYDALVQRNMEERPETRFKSTYASTFVMQTEQLTLRWFRSYWRNPEYNTTRFAVAVIIALYFGIAFLQQGSNLDTSQDIQGIVGLLFMATNFMSVMSQNTAMPTVYIERAPFYRERAASYYGVAPVVIATTVSELPYIIAAGFVFCPIFYFIAGLWANAVAFFWFWGFYTLFNTLITFWGHLLSTALPNDQVANLLGAVIFSSWCFSCGLMIAIEDIPYFWQWYVYLNPLRYALNGIVVSQLACEDPLAEPASNPGCAVLESGQTAWEYTKDRFGYTADDTGFCLGACFGFTIGYRIISALCYKYVSYLKR
ncbi:ABC transporter G family member 35 [Hondaea fermentalgiana]|uniref:ABC transporter G family member 35 n=1 Tax=Hondaea fermentalgiana TaxID=2315210 RepID=A0A2R5H2A4_9STRA|nr:ABC transporter G family member 35 [Hondaea fermentalgiana]|eukprot:GBG34971.1 ABC transporter G family member 35 [Hondaea fermentalgiana]